MVDTDTLARVPLFASLTQPELQQIAPWFEAREVSEGVELVGQGASGYTFFILVDGGCAVSLGHEVVAQIAPGDFFGESAIVGGGRRNATIATTTPSKLLTMFGTEFRRLQQAQPAIASAIEDTARERLAADGL